MRKVLGLLVAAVLMMPVAAFAEEPQSETEPVIVVPEVQETEAPEISDIDETVEIDVIMEYLIGDAKLTDDQIAAADINGDGFVNVLDIQQMLDEAEKIE